MTTSTSSDLPTCPACGGATKVDTEYATKGPNWGALVCDAGCVNYYGQPSWIKWVSNPDKKAKRKSSQELVERYGRGWCEACLRTEEEIPGPKPRLVPHHVIQVCDGGSDDRENVWVLCGFCHNAIHASRTYLSHYRIGRMV